MTDFRKPLQKFHWWDFQLELAVLVLKIILEDLTAYIYSSPPASNKDDDFIIFPRFKASEWILLPVCDFCWTQPKRVVTWLLCQSQNFLMNLCWHAALTKRANAIVCGFGGLQGSGPCTRWSVCMCVRARGLCQWVVNFQISPHSSYQAFLLISTSHTHTRLFHSSSGEFLTVSQRELDVGNHRANRLLCVLVSVILPSCWPLFAIWSGDPVITALWSELWWSTWWFGVYV